MRLEPGHPSDPLAATPPQLAGKPRTDGPGCRPASSRECPGGSPELLQAYKGCPELEEASRLLEARSAALGGFAGASLAFFLAAWKDLAKGGPALIITATEEEADELEEELGTFAAVPVHGFPAWDSLFLPDSAPDPEVYRRRLHVLQVLSQRPEESMFVVAPVQAVIQPVPALESLENSKLALSAGEEMAPAKLAELLVRRGFRHVPLVEARGEFSLRGDILDVFPHGTENPLRLEFLGDTIESLREFSAESQRSLKSSDRTQVVALLPRIAEVFQDHFRTSEILLTDLLGPSGRLFIKEPNLVEERVRKFFRNAAPEDGDRMARGFLDRLLRVPTVRVHTLPMAGGEGGLDLRFGSVERFRGGDLAEIFRGISQRLEAGHRFEVYCETAAEARRLREILEDHKLSGNDGLRTRVGPVRRGFDIPALEAVVLTSREIFNRHVVRRFRRKTISGRAIQSFLELQKGDCIVHLAHGIGRYLGMEAFEKDGVLQEFLALEFRDGVKVYVPVSKVDLVQKYIGSGDREPILDKVGGTSWTRKKEAVEAALVDLASDCLEIQALRQERPGFSYPPRSDWGREFEAAFPFEETPDQVEVTAALHEDMESPRPMDRLICGDVGYGKTELAMRATFKAVDAGKQVAVLVPTTVLAQQHFRTFGERMAEFPITIEVLSRFRTPGQQRETVERLAEGKVDVVIGTHRLLSDDVSFRDLGLVIIDEEQRFGVAHKEKLKKIRSTVDVLTLTATPIPRTLHMALLGLRDISSLTTAPEGRSPVKTEITRFEPRKIREVLLRELNRDGQVYFVHNRVEDIDRVQRDLQQLVPEARIEYAHGQMNEHELEDKMMCFFEGEIDILVSTTIIENGLDIPNVNTIFIDEADRYGLADLHQLRGRVGRYKHQAYCYLVLPGGRSINPDAQKRIQALVEYSDLGSGFQIAMKDLEIRGAGNILGPEQSGHIAAVGYDMYCRLLEKAVRRLRNETVPEPVHVEVDLALKAFVPDDYRSGEPAKFEVYRRVAAATSLAAVDDLSRELEDRFGPYPGEVECLLDVQRLRLLAAERGVEYVGREGSNLVLKGNQKMQELFHEFPARVAILDGRTAAVSLVDPRRRYPPPVTDDKVFRTALEWFRTGAFPGPAGRLKAPVPRADRVASQGP